MDAANLYVPTATPGGRAPHAWMADGQSLFDRLGLEFCLLRLGPAARDANAIVDAAKRRAVPLRVVNIAADEIRDLYQADLVLLRPDQIVAWRGDAAPDNAESLLATVTGH